ncbi:MAG: hypothetical protein ABIY55_30550 [Kofleriaceae bacterium]
MLIKPKHTVLAVGALALGLAGASFAKPTKPAYVLVPAGTATFAPLDPKAPQGAQLAVISGDLASGPVSVLLKLPKGAEPLHWHTSDYTAVTLEGTAKHWLQGKAADAKPNPPGTSWFQPGGSAATAHGDECVSDSCTVFVYLPNGLDFKLAATR